MLDEVDGSAVGAGDSRAEHSKADLEEGGLVDAAGVTVLSNESRIQEVEGRDSKIERSDSAEMEEEDCSSFD